MIRRLFTRRLRKRYDLINYLIRSKGYRRYLEIGTRSGRCLERVQCDEKVGVDPEPLCEVPDCTIHALTSDEFFKQDDSKFDVVLIDGLHHSEQVLRDIFGSLNALAKGGTVLLHDCNPEREEWQMRDPSLVEAGIWNGDVWKAIVYVRKFRTSLFCRVFDFDNGVGVVIPPSQAQFELDAEEEARAKELFEKLSWQDLVSHRSEFLGLIQTKKDFLKELDRWRNSQTRGSVAPQAEEPGSAR